MAKPYLTLNNPEISYRPFISSNHHRAAMGMTVSANFAVSSTFIKYTTVYNVSEHAVEGFRIDPGFFPVDIRRRRILGFGIYALLQILKRPYLIF